MGGRQAHWMPLVQHFSRTHRVVTFALAGSFEASPTLFSPVRHASPLGFADDLALLCAEMGIRDAVYIGHSLSGIVGGLVAAADPGMFSRLVLLNASARFIDDASVGYVGGFSRQQVDQLLLAISGNYAVWSSGFAAMAMANAERPELATEFASSLRSYDPAVTLTMFRAAFTNDFRSVVPRITLPTLVLQSRDDPAVPQEAAQWLADQLPKGCLRIVASTGHFPHVVAPQEIIAEIEAFIRKP